MMTRWQLGCDITWTSITGARLGHNVINIMRGDQWVIWVIITLLSVMEANGHTAHICAADCWWDRRHGTVRQRNHTAGLHGATWESRAESWGAIRLRYCVLDSQAISFYLSNYKKSNTRSLTLHWHTASIIAWLQMDRDEELRRVFTVRWELLLQCVIFSQWEIEI